MAPASHETARTTSFRATPRRSPARRKKRRPSDGGGGGHQVPPPPPSLLRSRRPLTRVPRGLEGANEVNEKVVLEHDDLQRTLRRIAHEIAEKNPEPESLAIVGI